MNFGQELKRRRENAGMSQAKLAELAIVEGYSYSPAYISNIERGYDKNKKGEPTRPDKDLVVSIAQVLDWNVDEALISAGYAPQNKPVLPDGLQIMDFDGLDPDDIREIGEFIRFKKAQKMNKPASPPAESGKVVDINNEVAFSKPVTDKKPKKIKEIKI